MQHSLETIGPATSPRLFKKQILPPSLSSAARVQVEGSRPGWVWSPHPRRSPSPHPPAGPACAARGSRARRGPGREEAVLGLLPLGCGGTESGGRGRGRRGGRGVRWRAEGRECPRRRAPELPGGRVRAMALRLVSDFDLGKDVLPWLRAQRAALVAAGAGGGGPGAVGVRRGGVGRGCGGVRQGHRRRGSRSPSYLGGSRAGPGWLVGTARRAACAPC